MLEIARSVPLRGKNKAEEKGPGEKGLGRGMRRQGSLTDELKRGRRVLEISLGLPHRALNGRVLCPSGIGENRKEPTPWSELPHGSLSGGLLLQLLGPSLTLDKDAPTLVGGYYTNRLALQSL